MGDLDEFLLSLGVTRTHTGGYAAKYNVIVEQRIKILLGRMRANLHTALGENDYYDELAGVALQHANHLINVVPWTNEKCPHEALTVGQTVCNGSGRQSLWVPCAGVP